jgi:hypothetical protein
MARTRTIFHSSLDWSMLVELRHVLYAILDNYLFTFLDFKGTRRALHRLGWVAGANWH